MGDATGIVDRLALTHGGAVWRARHARRDAIMGRVRRTLTRPTNGAETTPADMDYTTVIHDPVAATLDLVAAFERGDVSAAERLFHSRRLAALREHSRWTVERYILEDWHPALADLAGAPRQVVSTARLPQTGTAPETWPVRLTIEGPNGRAYFTMRRFDETGVGSFGVAGDVRDGIQAIYIHCPQARRHEVAALYASLLGTTTDGRRVARRLLPGLTIAGTQPGEPMPQWPDPSHPQQMHLDLTVPDIDLSSLVAEQNGAALLRHGDTHRIFADPAGHPFCLYAGESDVPVIARLVVDCPDPAVMAAFYGELLGMPWRVEATPERIVIAGADARPPMLAFQRVAPYVPPRWGDARCPQQFHFDLRFDDAPASAARLERLDAPLLQPLGGTCPVSADPAGHPFCFCSAE